MKVHPNTDADRSALGPQEAVFRFIEHVSAVFDEFGVRVELGPDRENLLRRLDGGDLSEREQGYTHVVESQWLPNLLHELVHLLLHGSAADDHGFEYVEIPLDPSDARHCQWMWDEIAACALSTQMSVNVSTDPERFAPAWFAEQIEIQGVFWGLEDDLGGFLRLLSAQIGDPRQNQDLKATLERAWSLVQSALARVETPKELYWRDPRWSFDRLWAEYWADLRPTAGPTSKNGCTSLLNAETPGKLGVSQEGSP